MKRTNATYVLDIDPNNAESVLEFFASPIIQNIKIKVLKKLLEYHEGQITIEIIKPDFDNAMLQDCLDNGFIIQKVPYYVELAPSRKNNSVPDMFPNYQYNAAEEGEPVNMVDYKIGEYFRWWEIAGRFFIELSKVPKSDRNVPIGSFHTDSLLNIAEITQVNTTFAGVIIKSYTEVEFRAEIKSLTETAE